jgi:hypothetical protein
VAPSDQRVRELRPDQAIVLENLHPMHERLATRLPGLVPVARVEPRDAAPWDLTLVADTLWIDTNRGLCTLTWRGQIPLVARDQEGTIAITAAGETRPPSTDDARASGDEGPDFSHTMVDDEAVAAAFAPPKPVLPFAGGLSPFAKPSAPAPSAVAAMVPRAPAVSPPRPPLLHAPPSALTPSALAPPAPTQPLAPPPPVPSSMRSPASLYEASNAAAGEASSRLPLAEAAPPSQLGAAPSPRALVELVWYDPTKIGVVRTVPAWEPLLATEPKPGAIGSPPPPPAGADADAAAAAEKARRERADVHVVLGRAASSSSASTR